MAFKLIGVQYTNLTRLTLTFNDTVDPVAAANQLPSNYVLTGGIQFNGGLVIFGSTVSFDVITGFRGQLYDIQTNNIVSSGGATIDASYKRLSFYFGSGAITPMFVGSSPLGPAYIISDPALVGEV